MKTRYPDSLEEAEIDIEINFDVRGGLQRFKTIAKLQAWIAEERNFWSWLDQRRQTLGSAWETFWRFDSQIKNELSGQTQRWNQFISERNQLEERLKSEGLSDQEKLSATERIDILSNECRVILENMRSRISTNVQNEIVHNRLHLLRTEPESQYLAEIAATDADAAAHALSYFLARNRNEQGEFKGRMLAALYSENLNRKVRPDQTAFKSAITTWTEELADFKARYETQEEEFSDILQKHQDSEEAWKKRHDQLAEDFGTMRTNAETELKTLKDTYDAFMQLEAPREYWEKKRIEHAKGKKIMGWASGIAAVIGAGVLGIVVWFLLPVHHPSSSIPWQQIGFFFLASTFILWLVRLLVRLMLSHIHLHADAREREVMISTFLALIHRQESREGLKKEDIALVLAPIFRPSTSGVIKDDGGPQSFGDLLSALTGGRN
ncbi:MAG: DUF6161 domain-containing protein [Akkermansiaceae bacterium]|jgi:hypothetical protein